MTDPKDIPVPADDPRVLRIEEFGRRFDRLAESLDMALIALRRLDPDITSFVDALREMGEHIPD